MERVRQILMLHTIPAAAAAAAKSLHSCPTLGFSRQEHWSELPFPSPTQESEKWKWSRSVVSDPQWPHGLQPTRLLRPWDFPGKSTGVGCHCLLRHTIPTSQIFWGMRPNSLSFNKPMKCFWWMQRNLRTTVLNVVFKRGARCSWLRWYLPACLACPQQSANTDYFLALLMPMVCV